MSYCRLPSNFAEYLQVANAAERFAEAQQLIDKIEAAGVALMPNCDHAAFFLDPPHAVASGLKKLGYVMGWDQRCYPSPVDGEDFINVSAKLPEGSARRAEGWFDYVATIYPVDTGALNQLVKDGLGNPFLHHLTPGVAAPPRNGMDEIEYCGAMIKHMRNARRQIADFIGEEPGTLIAAVPQAVMDHPDLRTRLIPDWFEGLQTSEYQIEAMQGGGTLLQFFVLTGGRIEVAMRVGTTQTFNPKSVNKISRDEISTIQTDHSAC